jgi:hypothetical protein
MVVCLDVNGEDDEWHENVNNFLENFFSQFLVTKIRILDEKSIQSVEYDKSRVHITHEDDQFLLRGYRESVESLSKAIDYYENEPIEETVDKLQESQFKLLCMERYQNGLHDDLLFQINSERKMASFKGPRILVKESKLIFKATF